MGQGSREAAPKGGGMLFQWEKGVEKSQSWEVIAGSAGVEASGFPSYEAGAAVSPSAATSAAGVAAGASILTGPSILLGLRLKQLRRAQPRLVAAQPLAIGFLTKAGRPKPTSTRVVKKTTLQGRSGGRSGVGRSGLVVVWVGG